MSFTIQYMLDKKKTGYENIYLNSGVNCSVQTVHYEMMTTKNIYRKPDKRMFYQFVQSFPSDTKLTPKEIHRIGLEFAQKQFAGFEVLVSTHCNTKNLHNHILVNSVSFKTGKKLHQNHDNLLEHRNVNDEICLKFGEQILTPYVKGQKNKGMSSREYRSALKGQSWKMQMANTIDDCMKFAQNKEHFIYLMESEGYKVTWTDSRKNITFMNENGNKARDKSLHDEKYLKERMENEFRIRETFFTRAKEFKQTTDNRATNNTINRKTLQPTLSESSSVERCFESDDRRPVTDLQRDYFDAKQNTKAKDNDRLAENIYTADRNSATTITGWETEREILFYEEIKTSEIEFARDTILTTNDCHSNDDSITFDNDKLNESDMGVSIGNDDLIKKKEEQEIIFEMTMGGYL